MSEEHATSSCPRSGGRCKHRHRWVRWLFPITGLVALIWFLIRVLPKPSRAAYPCQQAAMPLASGFIVWLVGLLGSVTVFQRARTCMRESQLLCACVLLGMAVVMGLVSLAHLPHDPARADEPAGWGAHGPLGEGKGIHPGRVVWVYDPDATNWEGYQSTQRWFQDTCTDPEVVEKMVSQAIRGVAGLSDDEAAWDAVFWHFNAEHGRGTGGYQAGEKIAIKINLTTCNAAGSVVSPRSYNKTPGYLNQIDNSPQMMLALLRQLVNTVGVAQEDITIGDPTGLFANHLWHPLQTEFPGVHYLDNYGGSGRTRAEFSSVPVYWSTVAANNKLQDYLPVSLAEADYIINFAILKGHSSGVTLCAKNHYGSLIRTPSTYLRPELPALPNAGKNYDYYNLHFSLPNAAQNPPWSPGIGCYRALVDLMGHSELGGKTVLYLIDGLYGGYYWEGHPYPWQSWPFLNDWPSSILASQDPVAIDSVAYDFVNAEWPDVVRYGREPAAKYDMAGGAEDYLHEAALADAPPSGAFYDPDHPTDVMRLSSLGVHEHWDNPVDKQYSRNLGAEEGIQLIRLDSEPVPGDIDSSGALDLADIDTLTWLILNRRTGPGLDLDGDRMVDESDRRVWVKILMNTWYGDANLDGQFNSDDLIQVFVFGKYATPLEAGWAEGDWNGDGLFDSNDIVTAFADGGYENGP